MLGGAQAPGAARPEYTAAEVNAHHAATWVGLGVAGVCVAAGVGGRVDRERLGPGAASVGSALGNPSIARGQRSWAEGWSG